MMDDERKNDIKSMSIADKLRVRRAQSEHDTKSGEIVGTTYGAVDSAAHNEQMYRFNAQQGHGFAAEQVNDLIDKLKLHDATIVGNDNAKNGADRLVDGVLIQSKYCQNAQATVDAAFNQGTKMYRYIGKNGMPMQLEVPSDQYDEAVKIMRKRIADGRVPGVDDPEAATKLVRKGNVTYETACNIAKAGTIESLTFDAAHGAVIASTAFGISAIITFAQSIWSGKSTEEAIDNAMYAGLKVGGVTFVSSVISAQLTRTTLNAAIQQPLIGVIKALPPVVRKSMVDAMKNGALIYGKGTAGNLAKLWSSNVITTVIFTIVMSASDISNFFRGRISGQQLFKNVMTLMAGGGGAAAGATVGTIVAGPIGGAVGGVAGGVIGGKVANSVLSKFIEDDVVALVKILNERLIIHAQSYLLIPEELDLVVEDLQIQLVHDKLLDMYVCKNREKFADNLLITIIKRITRQRARIYIPDDSAFLDGLKRVIELTNNPAELENHLKGKKVDTVAIGKRLMNREISQHAADKAWYSTRQMNMTNMQQELILGKMKSNEEQHIKIIDAQEKELNQIYHALSRLSEE